MQNTFINAPIFTGSEWLQNHVVIAENGIIKEVISTDDLPTGIDIKDCSNYLLVPAFIDLQIYGAAGKLFSAHPQPETLQALYEYNLQHGTVACLVTIATQPLKTIHTCIDAIKTYWQQGGKGILGMHLEGPFINPTKRGAHIEEWVYSPTVQEVNDLLQKADGVIKMITVAPEVCSDEVLQIITDAGIIISAGHSNATFEQGRHGFENGITATTHLFNAMSPLHHRQPGLPAAAMQYAPAASIIPDGIHVHYEMVKLAKQLMSERLFFITDAVTDCNIGPYQHQLRGDHYVLPDGTLSGSALTMQQAVINAVRYCNIEIDEALRMASIYPAKLIGKETEFGRIAPGYPAPALQTIIVVPPGSN